MNKSSILSLSIGGATYDVFLRLPEMNTHQKYLHLPSGGKIRVEHCVEAAGGGAANTSVGLSRLGFHASFCGVIGSDQWGEMLLSTLQKESVDTSALTIVEDETSSFSIILSLSNGERTILYSSGANEHLHDTTFDKGALQNANVVYLNHLCETSCMIEDDILSTIAELKNIRLTWNPGGCQIDAGMHHPDKKKLLAMTTVLLLNKEEALQFTKAHNVEDALQILRDAGVHTICITDGKNGVIAMNDEGIFHCPTQANAKVVEVTGAGDAFGTGVTWALATGKTLSESLIAGTLNATSVVGSIGAQAGLLTQREMEDQLRTNTLSTRRLS